MNSRKQLIAAVGALALGIAGSCYAATARKEVAGRIILCDVWSEGASSTHCTNPAALPNAVLNVRREGLSSSSRVFASGRGRFSLLRIPGRYKASINPSYRVTPGCDLVSFPEGTAEKTVVVGPENKKKDLYFQERCPV